MVQKGSALVGLLVSLVIVVGLAVVGVVALSGRTGSSHGTPVAPSPQGLTDTARRAVNGAELAQVQAAADAYAAEAGMVPPDPAALVSGGELKTTPRCKFVIDPRTGAVGYSATQVDPACHP